MFLRKEQEEKECKLSEINKTKCFSMKEMNFYWKNKNLTAEEKIIYF